MTGFLDSLFGEYALARERHAHRTFLMASMAACALAATADGEVRFSERIRVDQVLDTLEALKVFDPHEGVALFNQYSQEILAQPRSGREQALADVARVATDPAMAARIVRICLAVAEAGGEASLVAQIEVLMLCTLLDVEPATIGFEHFDKILDPGSAG